MTALLPPELLSPEQREERAVALEREVSREWLRFAIAEALILWLPFVVFLIAYTTTDAISESALVPVAVVGVGISTVLVLYWVLKRIRPLQAQIESLRRDSARATQT